MFCAIAIVAVQKFGGRGMEEERKGGSGEGGLLQHEINAYCRNPEVNANFGNR
jgi:hypothetical protein